jgi:hypothetical protein
MASLAVGFIDSVPTARSRMIFRSEGFEVVRIDTSRSLALVMDLCPLRDFPHREHVRDAMRWVGPVVNNEVPIARPVQASLPEPAVIWPLLLEFGEKTVKVFIR